MRQKDDGGQRPAGAKSHMTVHSTERSLSHVNIFSSYRWESWPSDLLSNLPEVKQVQSGEICLSNPKTHSPSHQTVVLLRLWGRTLSYGQNVREQCVCVCLIRDFSAFLKPYQLSDILIHNPLNTVIFSCSVEGMVLEGGAEGRRQWRVDFATFHQACSHLIGCHGTWKGDEEGAKLWRYKCGFARSADSNTPGWTKKTELNVWMTGSFKLLFSCPGDKKSLEHFCLSCWQTSCHPLAESGRTISGPGVGSLVWP